MIDSGSISYKECQQRLTNLYTESNYWLVKQATKITRSKEEGEDLVQELYEYLHKKCNPNIFWGTAYNMFYCYRFLQSRWINKTKKLNRIVYKEDMPEEVVGEEYDIERDTLLENTHKEVVNELKRLAVTKLWPQAKIFELYWMSDKTLDEVAKDTTISKSTVFLSVKKIRKLLSQTIDNPFNK